MFRYVVLGLLQGGAPQHGYALMKEYRNRVGVQVSTGNFYRDLQRLVAGGLVRNADRASDGDPRRTPYQITDAGREAFRRWFTDEVQLTMGNGYEDELSARLAFLADVAPSDARSVLDRLQDDLWIRTKGLERARSAALAAAATSGTRGLPVLAIILARRLRRIAAELAFLAELRQTYESWLAERTPAVDTPAAPCDKAVPRARVDAKPRRR